MGSASANKSGQNDEFALPSQDQLDAFCTLVWGRGLELYRDLPWRRTSDPYAIWISEVMLQQTQVSRVDGRWQSWLKRFPTVEALAAAPQRDVLEEWQGMGYNRRALALLRAANSIRDAGAGFPQEEKELTALPGIGPATAAGIRAFAFNLPGVYLETNVRTVFLHELFPQDTGVPDRVLVPLVRSTCSQDDPRGWYYALLDYGAWLKRSLPNPSRRSRSHVRQSAFEGSHRQKRAELVRILLSTGGRVVSLEEASRALDSVELAAKRKAVEEEELLLLLSELTREGFCSQTPEGWVIGA
ncbi:MAG: adenine glycosylase [Coriobacteriales bacterium]|nr:adenine glycosylase [Coriobacteriales bacterium]